MTSLITGYGILAALVAKERLGIGQEIDTSIIGSMIELQRIRLSNSFVAGEEIKRGGREQAANPLANHYCCKDGKWLGLCVLASGVVWPDFCKALEIEDLEKDPRFASTNARAENCGALIEILDEKFAAKTRDEWVAILGGYHRIMFSPILDGVEVGDDVQALENNYVVEYDFPAAGIQGPAPEFGQHTEEVLLELGGCSWDDISRLKEEEVIG
jgi:crotonobetainyl-CoA:carnitine CoA-transferase CaiB-like acyl-CoA transferase